jgi:hypothetical protein
VDQLVLICRYGNGVCLVCGRSSEKREIALPPRGKQRLALVLFEPLVFVDGTPCQDGTRQIAKGGMNGELLCTQDQTPGVSHSEMAEPFDCADGISATAKTWVVAVVELLLGHFADMH